MIRVMLVDDHAVVREGYSRLLECQGDLRVVAEAGDGEQTLLSWREHPPDVTVIDPDADWTFAPEEVLSKSRNSPFLGREMKGRAALVVRAGRVAYSRMKGVSVDV